MERTTAYITEDQKLWLINNSITPMASKWGHEGKTQSEHLRAALERYIAETKETE